MKWRCGLAGRKDICDFDGAEIVEMYCHNAKRIVLVALGRIVATVNEGEKTEYLYGTCYDDKCFGGRIIEADKVVRDHFQLIRCRKTKYEVI